MIELTWKYCHLLETSQDIDATGNSTYILKLWVQVTSTNSGLARFIKGRCLSLNGRLPGHTSRYTESGQEGKALNKVKEADQVIISHRVASLNGALQFTKRVHGLPHLDFTALPWDGSDEASFCSPERCCGWVMGGEGISLVALLDGQLTWPEANIDFIKSPSQGRPIQKFFQDKTLGRWGATEAGPPLTAAQRSVRHRPLPQKITIEQIES